MTDGAPGADARDQERDELLGTLARHRSFLVQTLNGLSDEQAGANPTVSELCLGGLIKHTGHTERVWIDFCVRGSQAHGPAVDWSTIDWSNPGASWSTRRELLHVLAETAQHAGHADILRESIDGAKTMG